jgi:hypothetical protein
MNYTTPVICNKCANVVCYISEEYMIDCDIVCYQCKNNKKKIVKKEKKNAVSTYSASVKGVRKDVHSTYSFRSKTEANFARILNHLGLRWEYEERVFVFSGYKNKPHMYVMDFEVLTETPESLSVGIRKGFYEIKGYMTSSARSKFRRMKKQYEAEFSESCLVIYSKYNKADIRFCINTGLYSLFYDKLTEEFSHLPNWE